MILSPSLMESLPVVDLPIGKYYENDGIKTRKVFHFKGTVADYVRWFKLALAENSILRNATVETGGSAKWIGLENKETIPGMLESAHCETPFKAYREARANLTYSPARARPTLSPVGASFSVGRLIQGHPVAAYRRPRTKLPARDIDLSISVSASVRADAVTACMAKIMKAAENYMLAGGVVSVTCHYILLFRKPNPETKAEGIVFSLRLPMNHASSAAFGGSVQFFRALTLNLGTMLSGHPGDALIVGRYLRPGMAEITGDLKGIGATLEALTLPGE